MIRDNDRLMSNESNEANQVDRRNKNGSSAERAANMPG